MSGFMLITGKKRVARCAGHQDIKITRSYYATLQESTVIREVTQAFK